MLTLVSAKKVGQKYLMTISIEAASELSALPNETKPFDQAHFATNFDYGTPAENSRTECAENNKTYLYTGSAWIEAQKVALTALEATENKTYTAPNNVAYNSVVVNVAG